jgi:hypothetical protein
MTNRSLNFAEYGNENDVLPSSRPAADTYFGVTGQALLAGGRSPVLWNPTTYEAVYPDGTVSKQELGRYPSLAGQIMSALLSFGGNALLPPPARTVPYVPATYFYYSQGAAGTNSGTFANPYNTQASIPVLAANQGLLFKEGTTTPLTASIATNVDGTSSTPIVFGVYDATTGERISNAGAGLATIDASAVAIGIQIAHNYVCVDGLTITGANSASHGNIRVINAASNWQVINCNLTNAVQNGILLGTVVPAAITGTGWVIEGCTFSGNTRENIKAFIGVNDTTSKIQYNRMIGGTLGSIVFTLAVPASDNFKWSGTIACNVITGSSLAALSPGIVAGTTGGAPQIYRNVVTNWNYGILLQCPGSVSVDFTGAVVQNNDCIDLANFGIQCIGAIGPTIEYNRIRRCGSYDRGVTAGASQFGRGIELYGSTSAFACSNITVRYNYIDTIYNFKADFSEGVGIGFDNNVRNSKAYGNYVANTEGNAVQFNTCTRNQLYGNILYNNNTGTRSNPQAVTQGVVTVTLSSKIKIYNNTFIGLKAMNQKIGISENVTYDDNGGIWANNFITGFLQTGIMRNVGALGSTESYNVIEDCPVAVQNTSSVTIANGTGTSLVGAGRAGMNGPLYVPKVGGVCDNVGTVIDPSAVSMGGWVLGYKPPIGAFHPTWNS